MISGLYQKIYGACVCLRDHDALIAVLELHKDIPIDGYPWICSGCFNQEGYESDWPCPTIKTVATALGIDYE